MEIGFASPARNQVFTSCFTKSCDVIFSISFSTRLINCELEYDSAVITFTFAKLGREAT